MYSEGTIKIKNADGELVPFYPVVETTGILYSNTSSTVDETMLNIYNNIQEAYNSGGVKQLKQSAFNEASIETFVNQQSNETLVTVFEE